MEPKDHFDQAEPAEVSWEQNVGRWGRKLGFILAVWSFLALIPAAQTYLLRASLGHPITWYEALLISFVNQWIWAALTPGVLWLTDRYSIERRGWAASSAHLCTGRDNVCCVARRDSAPVVSHPRSLYR